MKDFKKRWVESAPLVMPIRIEKFDYTIEKIEIKCPNCREGLSSLRGKVYEAFDCVETDVVGVCVGCSLVVGHRSRYYPESGRCLMDGSEGWKEGFMVDSWFSGVSNFIFGIWMRLLSLGKYLRE